MGKSEIGTAWIATWSIEYKIVDEINSITLIYRQICISACKQNKPRRLIKWTSVLDMRILGYLGAGILPSMFGSRLKICQQERYQQYEQNKAYTIHTTWSGRNTKSISLILAWSSTSQFFGSCANFLARHNFLARVPLRVRRDVCS